jgi:rhamnosyltransferase
VDRDSRPARSFSSTEICAVVVTYNADAAFSERLARIRRQVGGVIVVDNGSDEGTREMLRTCTANPSIALVLNADNVGIARAFNIGVERAVALGFAAVLLMDHDTSVNEEMVEELLRVEAAHPARSELAVIGSGYHDDNDEASQASVFAAADSWEEVESVISSGSLIPLASHAIVGPFRDELFIDYVDVDYCLRARAKGLRVIKTKKPLMSHSIGASTRQRWLWTTKWVRNHSPDRRYYIARNDTVMLQEHGHYVLGLWALKSLGRRIRACRRIALYERMKMAKIMAVAEGWWDGVRGRLGPRAIERRFL